MSVYVQIIKGEYDDILPWPYKGAITFEIINWKDDSNHVKHTIPFNAVDAIAGGHGKKPKGEDDNKAWGYSKALSYYSNSQYIKNGILFIRLSNITLK